eukprot:scaffold23289_cov74-Cyclotella_meneghiniana.AAC.6
MKKVVMHWLMVLRASAGRPEAFNSSIAWSVSARIGNVGGSRVSGGSLAAWGVLNLTLEGFCVRCYARFDKLVVVYVAIEDSRGGGKAGGDIQGGFGDFRCHLGSESLLSEVDLAVGVASLDAWRDWAGATVDLLPWLVDEPLRNRFLVTMDGVRASEGGVRLVEATLSVLKVFPGLDEAVDRDKEAELDEEQAEHLVQVLGEIGGYDVVVANPEVQIDADELRDEVEGAGHDLDEVHFSSSRVDFHQSEIKSAPRELVFGNGGYNGVVVRLGWAGERRRSCNRVGRMCQSPIIDGGVVGLRRCKVNKLEPLSVIGLSNGPDVAKVSTVVLLAAKQDQTRGNIEERANYRPTSSVQMIVRQTQTKLLRDSTRPAA